MDSNVANSIGSQSTQSAGNNTNTDTSNSTGNSPAAGHIATDGSDSKQAEPPQKPVPVVTPGHSAEAHEDAA